VGRKRSKRPEDPAVPDQLPEQAALVFDRIPEDLVQYISVSSLRSIDRALRGARGWEQPEAPTFSDPTNDHVVELEEEGGSRGQWQRVQRLTDRYPDVFRLLTADAVENWGPNPNQPRPFWVDVRRYLELMGYQKASHGGWKPEHMLEVSRAIKFMRDLVVTVPRGSRVYPVNPLTQERKRTVLTAEQRISVLLVRGEESIRVNNGERFPLRFRVELGDWITYFYPEFGLMMKSLISMNARGASSRWAKNIGVEVSYLFTDQKWRSVRVKIRDLLNRARLLEFIEQGAGNRNRARSYFENACELLAKHRTCNWAYDERDQSHLAAKESGSRSANIEQWLEMHVIFTPFAEQRSLFDESDYPTRD
jgi:hypothetical protein